MARTIHSADQLDAIAEDLLRASQRLSLIASTLRESGMPGVLIHGTGLKTKTIPDIQDWIGKASGDVDSQIRSYLAGVQSKAELHKHQTAQQKKRAAKKPVRKKT